MRNGLLCDIACVHPRTHPCFGDELGDPFGDTFGDGFGEVFGGTFRECSMVSYRDSLSTVLSCRGECFR